MPALAEFRLQAVKVVLFEPRDPINIGAVVRAMKNMGACDLRLVRPIAYDVNRLEQVAHDTRDVVARIRHFDTLEAALADVRCTAAFTGRPVAQRVARRTPRELPPFLLPFADEGPVALLFGREDHGLPNEAVDAANVVVTIPTTEHYSLNLAQSVLLALYELHLAAGDATRRLAKPKRSAPAPTGEEWEMTLADIERALTAIAYFKSRNPEHVMRRIRSLLHRADPDGRELVMARTSALEVLRTLDRERRALLRELGVTEDELAARRAADGAAPAPSDAPEQAPEQAAEQAPPDAPGT